MGSGGGRDVLILSLGVMPTYLIAGCREASLTLLCFLRLLPSRPKRMDFARSSLFTKQDLVELQGSILVKEAFPSIGSGYFGKVCSRHL